MITELSEQLESTNHSPTNNKRSVEFCIVSFLKEFNKYEANETIRNQEIVKLITIFLKKGNNISKIINETPSEEDKIELLNLQKKYNIKDGVNRREFDVTLSRISHAFPLITFKIMQKERIRRPGENALRSQRVNLPSELYIPMAFSVIPKTIDDKDRYMKIIKCMLLAQHYDYEVIKNKVPSYKVKKLNKKLRDLLRYSAAAYKSALTTDEDRNTYGKDVLGEITKTNLNTGGNIFYKLFGAADYLIKESFGITD